MGTEAPYVSVELMAPCIRLMADVAIAPVNLVGKKRMLMDGLLEIFDCKMWFWFLSRDMLTEYEPRILSLLSGGASEEDMQTFIQSSVDLENPDPSFPHMHSVENFLTRLYVNDRSRMIDDEAWYGSGHYQKYRTKVGVDHYLHVSYPVAPRVTSVLGLHRATGAPAFTDDELGVLQILFREIEWLHQEDIPDEHGSEVFHLTPRLRECFLFLTTGMGRKQIAHAMQLSEHTINDYVKAIFNRYEVRSQVELIVKVYQDV